jgi:tetratricopeptide (TPR) repeat protein
MLFRTQGPAAALPVALESLAAYEKDLGPDHPWTANPLELVAQLYVVTGDFPKAEEHARRALAIGEQTFGPDHVSLATALQVLGFTATMTGRLPEARGHAERSVRVMERAGNPRGLAASLLTLGEAVLRLDGIAAARPHFERALATIESVNGKDNLFYADAENTFAGKLVLAGECETATPYIDHAYGVYEARRPDQLSMPLLSRAQCAQAEQRFADAITDLERATALCAKHGCEPGIGLPATAVLGQVLIQSKRDRRRGLELLGQARAGFAAKGMTDGVAETDRWLKEHGLRLP